MVLARSLLDNGTKKQLAALVTMDTCQLSTIDELKKVYDVLIPVKQIVNKSPANLYLMHRPDLISTFTKIELWRQIQFRKIVYLDADIVALRAPDELFAEKSNFAAVPDIGWPDCFNSGVMVLSPNMGEYYALSALAQRGISFDGADQGLLNMHFQGWQRLSFTYNCTPSGNYQYMPAYRHFQSSISILHFIGSDKPWSVGRDRTGATGVYEELLGRWWAVYDKHYRVPVAIVPGQSQPGSRTVEQYVTGETSISSFGFSSIPESSIDVPVNTAKNVLTGKIEAAEDYQQGNAKPTPTAQQRRWSIDWDPKQPEAAGLPSEMYTMSTDRNLFQPPSSYPEPPSDMSYQVPSTPSTAERPKIIFPWEAHQRKANRVFSDYRRPSSSGSAPSTTTDAGSPAKTASPPTPTIQVTSPDPFANFSFTNVWDEMPEIERYVANLPQYLHRTKIRAYHHRGTSSPDDLDAPPSPSTEGALSKVHERIRPSMRITDFPSEIERPSLPVTPNPIRRPSFWGQERDAAGDLPPAQGVPDQADWDPVGKLDELQQRQTDLLRAGPLSPGRDIPERSLPASSQPLPSVKSVPAGQVAIVTPYTGGNSKVEEVE
ncbi:MAG: hypothetical protein Q9186_006606 [Xanthomendoza sp. 1 TL-2023]